MGGWCNGILSTDSLNGFVWYTLSCFWNSDMGLGVSLEKQLVELKPRPIQLTYWVAHYSSTVEVACKFPLRDIFCKEVHRAGSHWLTLATEPLNLEKKRVDLAVGCGCVWTEKSREWFGLDTGSMELGCARKTALPITWHHAVCAQLLLFWCLWCVHLTCHYCFEDL